MGDQAWVRIEVSVGVGVEFGSSLLGKNKAFDFAY